MKKVSYLSRPRAHTNVILSCYFHTARLCV